MDHLWSPWRYGYLQKPPDPDQGCIFCLKAAENRDEQNYILHRASKNYVILNLYPYNTGHLMVVPYQHVATLSESDPVTLEEMIRLTREAERAIGVVYKPHGFNAGLNIGEAAGAGVAGHLHMHVLPRWRGDANFLSTIGETRVLPEELGTTYEKLKREFGR